MEEIEYRGPLTENQVDQLVTYLAEEGTLIKEEFERVVFFETANFPAIGDFQTGTSRLSLKSDNKGTYFRIKEGNPSDLSRKEFDIKIEENDISNLIYILNRLGLTDGFYRPTFRRDYKIGNLIISVKTKCVMGNHFEFELNDPDISSEDLIKKLILKFGLSIWSKNQYKERIANLMINNSAINIYESKIFH